MTDQEYEELKERLIKDGVVVGVGKKWEHYEAQRDYFKEAISYYRDNIKKFNHHYQHHTVGTMWNHIRPLIYQHYGVANLQQMKIEWKEEANKRAIDIMKLVEKEEE